MGRGQEGVVKCASSGRPIIVAGGPLLFPPPLLPSPLLQRLEYITAPYTQLPKVAEELQSKIRFPDKGPCKHTHTCAPLHTHVATHMCTLTHTRSYTHVHPYTHTRSYTHMCTLTHTRSYTHMQLVPASGQL